MGKLTVSILMLVFCVLVVENAPLCNNITCEDGEYCSGKECHPCPPRHYQSEPIHSYTSCIPWSTKPPLSHYVIDKNGTSTSDVHWKCQDGYYEKEYTVQSFECVLIRTTQSTTSTTSLLTTTENKYVTEPTTTSLPVLQQSESDNTGVIIGSVCGGGVLLIIIIVVCVTKRNHIVCFTRPGIYQTNGNTNHSSFPTESGSKSETEALNPNCSRINYRFCFKLVEELGVVKSKSFFFVLCDPSGKFNAGKVIEMFTESSRTPDVIAVLAKTFVKWIELNKGIYRSHIVNALEDISRLHVLEKVEALVHVDYIDDTDVDSVEPVISSSDTGERAANIAVMQNVRASSSGDGATSAGRMVISQDRFRLYYFITEKIEANSLITLLRQLPDPSGRFNSYNLYDVRVTEERDFRNAYSQTLEEWWVRNPDLSLYSILTDFLKEIRRYDVLEDSEFQSRLQKIVPAEASSSGSRDQEQHNSSRSLVLGNTDTEQLSDNTEVKQELHNTNTEQVSDDDEVDYMSRNTERACMSRNTERKQPLLA